MNGIDSEYLLGLYFFVTAITMAKGRINADAWRLVASLVLLVLAVLRIAWA
jgi:hypothetical protein